MYFLTQSINIPPINQKWNIVWTIGAWILDGKRDADVSLSAAYNFYDKPLVSAMVHESLHCLSLPIAHIAVYTNRSIPSFEIRMGLQHP